MKDREGANHHTSQPELAQPQEPHRYRVDHYGKSRNFAAYEGQTIIAVTLYRKGAAEIMARLEEKDRRIAVLESQLGLAAATKPKPTVRAPREENVRHSQLSREQTSSGKFLIRDDLFSKTCGRHSLSLRHIFRESD